MARFNEILAARYSKALQKVFGIKGGTPTPVLGSEVMPVFEFGTGVDMRFLEQWDRFGIYNTIVAGGAGNDSVAQLRNPTGSNTFVIVEKLSVMFSIADNAPIKMATGNPADLTNVLNGVALDSRGRPNSTAVYSSKSNSAAVGAGNSIIQASGSAAFVTYEVIQTTNQEVIVSPGNALTITATTLNTRLDVAIMWRERPFEDSEKF